MPPKRKHTHVTRHWSFMFGEIAAYSFAVLMVTGVFLMIFFEPSMDRTVYNGSYTSLRGVPVSEAYDSTLHISFDVRGGLLMRQIHHWAALIFIAAVTLQLLSMFFIGAFRQPRTGHWLIWTGLLVLGMAAGVTGTILPDDMLSGGSIGLIQGVTQSIPVVGTWLTLALFGGEIPGDQIITRMYWAHLLIPVLMLGLLALRYRRLLRPGLSPFRSVDPARRARTVAVAFSTLGVLTLLGTVAQINPVWLYGPYEPGSISAGSVPGWYMGFLDGAIRIMPGWETDVGGYTLTLAVLVPALIVPGAFFTLLAAYPFIERRLTGDRRHHHVPDRPRDTAARTALGAAGITFYGTLWAAASNDQIATEFHISLWATTWFFRIAVLIGPVLAAVATYLVCLGLREREREEEREGIETGIVRRLPDGGFEEVRRALPTPSREPAPRQLSPNGGRQIGPESS